MASYINGWCAASEIIVLDRSFIPTCYLRSRQSGWFLKPYTSPLRLRISSMPILCWLKDLLEAHVTQRTLGISSLWAVLVRHLPIAKNIYLFLSSRALVQNAVSSECQIFFSIYINGLYQESQTETCCVKKLCNLSYSTRSWVVNKKFYCTNAANHKEVLEDRDNQNLVDQDPRSGWNPPKIPFAIPYEIHSLYSMMMPNMYWQFVRVNSGYAPCPGPDTYTFSFGGDGINGHGLICLIDSQPSLSYQNQGQDSVVAAGTSSGIETSGEEFAEVPNSGNILYDEQSEKVIDSYSDSWVLNINHGNFVHIHVYTKCYVEYKALHQLKLVQLAPSLLVSSLFFFKERNLQSVYSSRKGQGYKWTNIRNNAHHLSHEREKFTLQTRPEKSKRESIRGGYRLLTTMTPGWGAKAPVAIWCHIYRPLA